ncbi:MAG: hypothetical protein JJU12_02435 [Chlamydiales bacterium]|nr:hypothetical protein [Chlamydiales bacterium]
MAFLAVHCFNGSKVPMDQTNKPKLFDCSEKAALITDLAIAALFTSVGVLAIIQMSGLANLGPLSCLDSMSSSVAGAMILTGVGIVAVDLIKLMIQQACYINKFQAFKRTQNLKNAQVSRDLIKANAKLDQLQKSVGQNSKAEDSEEANGVAIDSALSGNLEQLRASYQDLSSTLETQKSEIERLEKELKDVEEASQQTENAYQNLIGNLEKQLDHVREEKNTCLSQIETLEKELESRDKKINEEYAKQTPDGEAKQREIDELKEKLKEAQNEKVQHEEKIQKLRAEITANEESAKKIGVEKEAQIQMIQQDLEKARANLQQAQKTNEQEVSSLQQEKSRLEEEVRKKNQSSDTKEETTSKDSSVGQAFTASLLENGKASLSSKLKAPQMTLNAKEAIMKLAEMAAGRLRIKTALSDFKTYLENKQLLLSAKENLNCFNEAQENLVNSLIASDQQDPSSTLERSYLGTVEPENLSRPLQSYFDKLYDWIKEATNLDDQIERINLAMEQLTTDLIDAVNSKSDEAKRSTQGRTESDRAREAELIKLEKEKLAKNQKQRINKALTFSPYQNQCYNLSKLNFTKLNPVQKMQIHAQLSLKAQKNNENNADGTIQVLTDLFNSVTGDADSLLAKDLKESLDKEIKGLEEASEQLRGYLEKIGKVVKYEVIFPDTV